MRLMTKYILACLLLVSTLFPVNLNASFPPDEGMWLPLLIKRLNYEDMKKLGCKLTADEIYSVNNSSVKDAIVQLGGFCTAEVVSDQGLLLTNHHCAYDAIRSHSTVENDYLTDGFWAMSKAEEKHVEGLTVKFLVRMEDVTKRILDKADAADEAERDMVIGQEMEAIEAEAKEGNDYTASVRDMFHGNEYYLFVYEVFRDIRLVGAPPSSIGKFGGDTDNWMWPRHTGDFSVLRIYAGADNKPADFSEDNKPYKPKHHLPVSIKGIKNGDFAMIMGYPGSTDRYLTASHIDEIYNDQNPDYVKLMERRLEIMKEDMDASDEIRIKLASNYASLANYWKYCKGQNNTLRTRGLQEEKKVTENKFKKWVNGNADRKAEYGDALDAIAKNIADNKSNRKLSNYLNFAGFGPGFVNPGVGFFRVLRTMQAKEDDKEAWTPVITAAVAGVEGGFEEYSAKTDQKIFAQCLKWMKEDLPKEHHLDLFSSKLWDKRAKAKGDMDQYEAFADYTFKESIVFNKGNRDAFVKKPSMKALENDPAVAYISSLVNLLNAKYRPVNGQVAAIDEMMMRKYVRGVREMETGKSFYPDANSTMRLTYGTVKPYVPRDAVNYNWYTTTDGIFEKENPKDEEFIVPGKLMDLIADKDFGQYGSNGQLNVCFLTNNDITGGNSGSPVINGSGELIGIAFDGNWESMASDLVFDDDVVRTISVDIRYVLFIIDKFAGAKHLVDEMTVKK